MKNLFCILFFATLGPLSVFAQNPPPLVTDRPDFTESAVVVPTGSIQIEAGATNTDRNGNRSTAVGEALVRYGLSQRFELRAILPSFQSGDGFDSGFDNLSLGFKTHIAKLDNGLDIAFLGAVQLPTGDDQLASGEVTPSFILTSGISLSDRVSLGSQFSGSLDDRLGKRVFNSGLTLVSAFSISPKFSAFTEMAASFPDGGDTQLTFHTGLLMALGPRAQFDIHGGLGLTDFAPDSFIGAGVSFRK